MNRKEFSEICKMSDQILYNKTNIYKSSNSWIHIIRSHPDFLDKYKYIFKFKKTLSIKILHFKIIIKYLIQFLLRLKIVKNTSFPNINEIDILFISHFHNKNQIFEKNDFFYGDIQKRLGIEKIQSLNIYINHTDKNYNYFKFNKKSIILPKYLNIFLEIKIFTKLLLNISKLNYKNYKKINTLKKNFLKRAKIEMISPESCRNLRLSYQFDKAIKHLKPKLIIFTFEGHAWERNLIYAAKKFNKKIKCFGYNHSIVSENQYSMKKIYPSCFNPDKIFVSGKVALKQLKKSDVGNKIQISILGSNRTFKSKIKSGIKDKKICLVIPEGIRSEVLKMLELIINASKIKHNIKFIFRLHPIINLENILSSNKNKESYSKNIFFSNKSFEDDLKKSSYVLYRGSTAVIAAVQAGLYPIYFHKKNEIRIDPLIEIAKSRKEIENETQLINLINSNENFVSNDLKRLVKYSNNYYEDFKQSEIDKLINNI